MILYTSTSTRSSLPYRTVSYHTVPVSGYVSITNKCNYELLGQLGTLAATIPSDIDSTLFTNSRIVRTFSANKSPTLVTSAGLALLVIPILILMKIDEHNGVA